MRIVFLSDTHNLHRQISIPDGDVLVHAGDAGEDGTRDEIEDFVDWLSSLPHRHKIFVGGNHDEIAEEEPSIVTGPGVHHLWDSEVTIDGIRFYGSPWRVVGQDRIEQVMKAGQKRELKRKRGLLPSGENLERKWSAFMVSETWADLFWHEIPEGVDVLVTHMPPFGVLDWRGKCGGSPALLHHIKRAKPRLHVFGHIHGDGGKSMTLSDLPTTFLNVASCADAYPKVLREDLQVRVVDL